jgi:predicted RNA binding protein YcfA (HicA-like mRNA interferase family)
LYFAPPDSEKKAPKEKKENAPKEKKENAPANGERPKTQGFKSPSPMRARKIGKKPVGPYVTEGFLLPGTSKNFERILSEIKRLGEEVTGLRQLNNEMLDHEAMLEDQLASSRDQIKELEAKLKASEEQLLYRAEQVVEEKKISEAVENIDKSLKKFNGLQPIHASGIKDRLLKEQLQATGWGYWKRDNGGTGHLVFAHPKTGATVAIPHHPSRDISSVMRSHLMKRINLGSKLA